MWPDKHPVRRCSRTTSIAALISQMAGAHYGLVPIMSQASVGNNPVTFGLLMHVVYSHFRLELTAPKINSRAAS